MISPWAIYLVDVLRTVGSVVEFVLGGSLICTLLFLILYLAAILDANRNHEIKEKDINQISRWVKLSAIITAVSAIFVCLIPAEETMYAMLIVDQLTPENIKALRDFGVETVQQLGDAIANSINKVEVK